MSLLAARWVFVLPRIDVTKKLVVVLLGRLFLRRWAPGCITLCIHEALIQTLLDLNLLHEDLTIIALSTVGLRCERSDLSGFTSAVLLPELLYVLCLMPDRFCLHLSPCLNHQPFDFLLES